MQTEIPIHSRIKLLKKPHYNTHSFEENMFVSFSTIIGDDGVPNITIYKSGYSACSKKNIDDSIETDYFILNDDCQYVKTTYENYDRVRKVHNSVLPKDSIEENYEMLFLPKENIEYFLSRFSITLNKITSLENIHRTLSVE